MFRSSIGQGINRHANYYFHIFIAILGLVFLGKTVIQTHKESYALYKEPMSVKKLLNHQAVCGSFDMGLISTITMSDLRSAEKMGHSYHII